MYTPQTSSGVRFYVAATQYSMQQESNTFLRGLVRGSWLLFALAAFIQNIFYPGLVNLTAMGYVAFAWLLVTNIFLQPQVLKNFPLSSFLIIGFGATQFYFPLLFTTLEGKPLIFNLQIPTHVFVHSTLALLMLCISHSIYRSLTYKRVCRISQGPRLLRRFCLFETPSDQQVWIMGALGLGAMFISSFLLKGTNAETGVGSKVAQGLMAFSYAPFFIPFGKLYGRDKTETKQLGLKLAVFALLLFLVSIGRNSRGAFMMGFTSLGFAFALGLMLGVLKTRLFTIKNAVIAGGLIWLLTGPIADIGTAMLLVRHQRTDISSTELVSRTFEAYKDKKAVKEYQINAKEGEGHPDWDEKYLDNIFLARFCNIKFNDLSLNLALQMDPQNNNMTKFSTDRLWAILPQPLLNILNPNVDKLYVNSMSFGDYLRYQVSKTHQRLGSFVVGHLSGTGMAAFGWWYLLLLGIGIMPAYYLIDALHIKNHKAGTPAAPGRVKRRFSLCALLNLTLTFQFLPSESLVTVYQFLIRGWWQLILLYVVLFYITRAISNTFAPVQHFFKR